MGGYFKYQTVKDPEFNVGADIWTVNTGWVVEDGRAKIDGSQVGAVILQQDAVLKAAVVNKVYLNIPVLTAGSLKVLFGTADIGDITVPGCVTLLGTPIGNTNLILTADADLVCEITQVHVMPYTAVPG